MVSSVTVCGGFPSRPEGVNEGCTATTANSSVSKVPPTDNERNEDGGHDPAQLDYHHSCLNCKKAGTFWAERVIEKGSL